MIIYFPIVTELRLALEVSKKLFEQKYWFSAVYLERIRTREQK